jgi:hypothetical protein
MKLKKDQIFTSVIASIIALTAMEFVRPLIHSWFMADRYPSENQSSSFFRGLFT